jgi:hypothetical protein
MAPVVIPDVPQPVTQPANKAGGRTSSLPTRTGGAISSCFQETHKLLRPPARTGRPAGDAAFVARLEELSGRFLAPRKAGRPAGDPAFVARLEAQTGRILAAKTVGRPKIGKRP